MLKRQLFTSQITVVIEHRLASCDVAKECRDLLLLLLGRVLQIEEGQEMDVEDEICHIIEVALPFRTMNSQTSEVVLSLIATLPTRTEQEITYILQLARDTQDETVHEACAQALCRSWPENDGVRAALATAQTSDIAVIQKAAKERLAPRPPKK